MIAILADDLTSALDGAAPFAAQGLAARVLLAETTAANLSDVIARDLNTRFLPPDEAERRFFAAGKALTSDALIYKTIDSTLRGNLKAEIGGLAAATGRERIVIAPAFPSQARVTKGSVQYVDGVPVHDSAYSRNPRNPVPTSNIAELLRGMTAGRPEVYDASSDADLDHVVESVGLAADVIWVGSPGLGQALARAAAPSSQPAPLPGWKSSQRSLVIVGSVHPANSAQIAKLLAEGAIVIESAPARAERDEALAERLGAAFGQSSLVCLSSPRAQADSEIETASRLGAAAALAAPLFDGIVVTGGETARAIADALRASSIELGGEVEPGITFGLIQTDTRAIPFAAKAGGFGSPESLLACVKCIQSQDPIQS